MSKPPAGRWVDVAAVAWAVLFAAPHMWWALGVTAGFPGGEESYTRFMSSTWRFVSDLLVVALSLLAALVVVALARPAGRTPRRWLPQTMAWIACGMLSLRGLAGLVVDGTSDLIWWPTFLLGGVLFGVVAWRARAPRTSSARAV